MVVLIAIVAAWCLHVLLLKRKLRERDELIQGGQQTQLDLENQLRLRTHRLDDLLSAVKEPVLRVNRSAHVLSANHEAIALFCIRDVETLPEPMVVFYRNPDWLKAFEQAVQALPKVTPLPELFINEQVYLPRLASLCEDEGLLLCLDVTDQYRLQQQRKTFVADLMHDLKTPLTSLLGYARSIEAFADDAALRQEAVTVIADEALHVNSLLDALLSVEQIDYKQVQPGACDAVLVCQQVWQTLQPEMLAKGVRLHVDMPESFAVAMHEADCFRVLMNVASNAVHYTAEKSALQCSLQAGVFSLVDEGDGIPEKDLAHVTERFYRVNAARTRGGHGLGLAIVKEILDRDGGKLVLENGEERGLCVRIEFPVEISIEKKG